MIRIPYVPARWYWKVGDKSPDTQVYSSAVGAYVPLNTSAYVSWLSAGGKATNIDTEQNLADVLSEAGQPSPPAASQSTTLKGTQFDNIPRALQVWAFAAENRVRVLEGQPTRTAAQFKSYVLGLPGW